MSSKKFAARVFAYIKQVNGDSELPSAAVRVALVIADHWNEEDGFARISTDTIADEGGIGQGTVRRMLPHLIERGHLTVEFGCRGSGHCSKYFPLEQPTKAHLDVARKEPTVAILEEAARERFRQIKEPKPQIKEPPLAMNTLEHTSGPPGPRSVPVESLVVEPATMRAPEGAQANPVEREEQMLTPEQKDAVAELLQYKWTPRELADAAGCPDNVPIMLWLAQHGLAEQTPNGWKFRKNLN